MPMDSEKTQESAEAQRVCKACATPKPATEDFFEPGRSTCRRCRNRAATLKEVAAGMPDAERPLALQQLPRAGVKGQRALKRAAILAARKEVGALGQKSGRDVAKYADRVDLAAKAMSGGLDMVVAAAPDAMATFMTYLKNPASPHHMWAMEFFLERVLPQRMYTTLGLKSVGEDGKKVVQGRAAIMINVMPAAAPAPQGRVISVTAVREDGESEEEPE